MAANGAVAALAASAETTVGAATSKVLAVRPTVSAPPPMSDAAGAANSVAVWNCVGTAAAAGDVIEDGGAADGAPSMM